MGNNEVYQGEGDPPEPGAMLSSLTERVVDPHVRDEMYISLHNNSMGEVLWTFAASPQTTEVQRTERG